MDYPYAISIECDEDDYVTFLITEKKDENKLIDKILSYWKKEYIDVVGEELYNRVLRFNYDLKLEFINKNKLGKGLYFEYIFFSEIDDLEKEFNLTDMFA